MKIVDHFLTKEDFEIVPTAVSGILKTSPVPENLDRYYDSEDYISHHQDKGGLKETIYKFLQNINLRYKKNILTSRIPQQSKILDYGCGAGEFLKFIEDDFETLGYEPDEDARKAAALKTKKSQLLSSLDLIDNNSLQAITLWHVFEHIENQAYILNIFYNKLNSKGLLIIAVPNHTSYDAGYYKEHWAAYDVPRHIFHFSKNGFTEMFKNLNWNLREIKPLLLDSYYISILSEKYRKNPFFWIKGPFIGAISNLKASKNGEFSSLIYILEKK